MDYLYKFCSTLLRFAIPVSFRDKFVLAVMSALRIRPLPFAYTQLGILKYQNHSVSGESFVLKKVLPELLPTNNQELIMFDVGSNAGNYSQLLYEHFPNATIFSFEPNPNTFDKLTQSVDILDINTYNIGFSDHQSDSTLFTYKNNISSSHASIYKDVLTSIHKSNSVEHVTIRLTEIDSFCKNNNIDKIDFLKIDTEGNELKVLKGAKNLLSLDAIKFIQFEFNEMNVISRVFLKDFFDLLQDKYNIYRMDSNRLINLPTYSTEHEIFKFQNILAVHKFIDKQLKQTKKTN